LECCGLGWEAAGQALVVPGTGIRLGEVQGGAAIHCKLSVGLCGGGFLMHHACLGTLAKSSGPEFCVGMRVTTDKYDKQTNPCSGL
jgi:hypothetical protein